MKQIQHYKKDLSAKLFGVCLLVLIGLSFKSVRAQYPIKINTQVTQPVSPYLPQLLGELQEGSMGSMTRDITDRLHITLTNTGNAPKNVKLSGKLERLSPSPMSISLRPEFSPPHPVLMNPSQMVQANRQLLNEAFGGFKQSDLVFNNTGLSDLRQNAMNYKLPEGTYRVCFSAFDYEKGGMSGPLSAPGTGCATFMICYSASAPQIIQPVSTMGFNSNEFQPFTPHSSQVQFTWTAPSSTCGLPVGALTYDLTIREVFEGQTIKDALFNPPVFQRENIHNTTFLLDTLRFPDVMRSNHQYVFQVKANIVPTPNNPIEIQNGGYSQIAGLLFNPETDDRGKREKILASGGEEIPKTETAIRGRLSYKFAEDPDTDLHPLANQKIYLKRIYVKSATDADGITRLEPLSKTESAKLPPYSEMLDGKITETDENGNFELNVGMTEFDGAGLLDDTQWAHFFEGQGGSGAALTSFERGIGRSLGGSIEDLKGKLVQMYKVEVVNPHFKASENHIQISPGEEKDLKNVVFDANSYTLKVNVKEVIGGQEGAFATDTRVNIYRLTKNKKNPDLFIPYFEGDLLNEADWKEEGDRVLIASRKTPVPDQESSNPEDYTVDFPRLFRSSEGEMYDYIVALEDGNGTIRMPTRTFGGAAEPIIPITSGLWGEALLHSSEGEEEAQNTGGQEILKKRGTFSPGASLNFKKRNQRGVNIGTPQLDQPGFGPNAGDLSYPLSLEEEGIDPPVTMANVNIGDFLEFERKWKSWSYNEKPDVAYLTLEKELTEPPHSVVTGKLEYKYKGDPSIPGQPYAHMPVKLMVFYLMKDGGESGVLAENGDYYSGVVEAYSNQDLPSGYGHARRNPSEEYLRNTSLYDDNGKVLQTVYTDAEGRFTFDFENMDSTMQIVSGGVYQDYVGEDLLDTESLILEGDFMRVYRVVPDVNQYTAPDEDIEVQPWSNFDCGTLTSYVRTFNMEVAVRADEGSVLDFNDIPVQLYYNPDAYPTYPIPTMPGVDLNKPMDINGQNYILLRQDLASERETETIEYGVSEAAADYFERQSGGVGSFSNAPTVEYQIKVTRFEDLVISQSAANYGRSYYVEAGGFPLERRGSMMLESDYLVYPQDLMSANWDSEIGHAQEHMNDHISLENENQEKKILFNSDFDPNRTVRVFLAPEPSEPRIAGRLVDAFTTLGVQGSWGSILLEVKQSKYGRATHYTNDGPVEVRSEEPHEQIKKYRASTDENGYFDITEFTDDFKNEDVVSMDLVKMTVNVPGYNDTLISVPQVMHQGEQIYMDPIVIDPKCGGCYGFVADADDHSQGVAARIKILKNGRWVDTYPVTGGLSGISANSMGVNQGLERTILNGIRNVALSDGILHDSSNYRPLLGRNGINGKRARDKRDELLMTFNQPDLVPKSGPYDASFLPFSYPPGDEWQTFGNLRVRLDESQNQVAEAEIVGNAANVAGVWRNYVNTVNGIATEEAGTSVSTGTMEIVAPKQRFDLSMPLLNTGTKIVILPYDRSYIPDTVEVNSYENVNLGTFYMKRRKHKVRVSLAMWDTESGETRAPVGAKVSIDGVEGEQVVNEEGEAYFEFVNNSTTNFTLRVRPQLSKSVEEGLQAQMYQYTLPVQGVSAPEFANSSSRGNEAYDNFVPRTVNFSNEDDNEEHLVRVRLKEGLAVSGRVTLEEDGSPLENAVVYLDRGEGIQSDIKTVTDQDGNYTLIGIPKNENIVLERSSGMSLQAGVPERNENQNFSSLSSDGVDRGEKIQIGASYSDKKHTYIGEVKDVNVAGDLSAVNFEIRQIENLDITHLYGFPVRLTDLQKEEDDGLKVSGEFFDLPENPNFSMAGNESHQRLSFKDIPIAASSLRNMDGVSLAVPVSDQIALDVRELSVKAFDVFNARVGNAQKFLKINKLDSDSSGVMKGNVRIVDNSFNFPSSYMTISDTDFYLGNFETEEQNRGNIQLQSEGNERRELNPQINATILDQLNVPLFSSEEYPLTKFSLTDSRGRGIAFNYLGFDGVTGHSGERKSYIMGDSVNLYLTLSTQVQGGIDLKFNAGRAILTHDRMRKISNEDTLSFDLEEWDVTSSAWELSPTSGGIVLKEGILNTGIVGLPFTDMSIIAGEPYGELVCNSLQPETLREAAKDGKLVLGGGAAELRLYEDLDIVFAYDPDVGTTPGEGHYKFSLHSRTGKVAYFGGLDGMINAAQKLDIQFVSSLSNGEQLFAFDGEMDPIILYNQVAFTPQRLFNYKDHFELGGLMSMDVPDMPKNIGLELRYDYINSGNARNELTMGSVDFHFRGNGGSEFSIDMAYKDEQRIDKEVVALPGKVTLPNSNQTFNANLVSIVYEGAKDPIPATGKVRETPSLISYQPPFGSTRGGIRSLGYERTFPVPGGSVFAPAEETTGGVKIQTEIFIGTADQLFGDAANILNAGLSGMQSYGGGVYDAATGTVGSLEDFSNDIYNAASESVDALNSRGRQTYNALLSEVNSIRLETRNLYEQTSNQIDALRDQGMQAQEQVYGELLSYLDDLQSKGDELYEEVLAKRSDFLQYGNEIYNEVYGDVSGQAEGASKQAEEMYEELTGEVTEKIEEFQNYTNEIYGDVVNKAKELQGFGDELYDDLYNELSGSFEELKNKSKEANREVNRAIGAFRDYGTEVYTDLSGNLDDLVNNGKEVLEDMMGEVDAMRQQAEEAYNQVEQQIQMLENQGREAYAAAQKEMLAHLDDVRSQGEELYNELQTEYNEWTEKGQEILNDAERSVEEIEAYGREMYDELYQEVSGKADEIQAYAEGLYGGLEDEIDHLLAQGQAIYEDLYNDFSNSVDEIRSYGEDIYNDIEETLNQYKDYGEEIFNDMYGSVSDQVDEINSLIEGAREAVREQLDDVMQYGEELYDELLGGPLDELRKDVLNEMNELRNTADQYIEMGQQKIDDVFGKWPIAGEALDAVQSFDGNDVEGSLLRIAGDMVGFDGIKENVEDKLLLVANETVDGIKESLEIDNISESVSDAMSSDVFKGMNIDFDLATGRMTGSMYSDFISFGAVELSQMGIEVLIDGKGWYLYSGAGVDMPTSTPLNPIIFPIGIGFLTGMYPTISTSLESRVTQHSYVNQLPQTIMQGGISGFFLTGKKDILKPKSLSVDFAIVDFEIGASAGLDARLYANFGSDAMRIGLGAMAFADAYARLSVLGTCGISGAAAANVGIKATYENNPAGASLDAKACASVSVAGSAWCGWGPAKVSGSFNESVMAMLGVCAGSNCNKAVTMDLQFGSSCATSNDFDYVN